MRSWIAGRGPTGSGHLRGSDCSGESVERGWDRESRERMDPEFVVAASEVLHERRAADHDRGSPVAFEAAHRAEPGLEAAVVALLRCGRPAPGSLRGTQVGEAAGMKRRRSRPPVHQASSAFAGFRFPPEVILLAVRWYLLFGLSYRDLEELLVERGIEVDHVTLFRWVQRFTPLLIDAARPSRHIVGDRWFVDETYVKVSGTWRYVYRAVDQNGQVIDVYVSKKRDANAATRFFATAIGAHDEPVEVTTDKAPTLARAIDDLVPGAFHNTEQYANNRVECDHGRLKARLRPMRGLKRDRTASVVIRGSAFMQNLRRGHYELGVHALPGLMVAAAFDELARAV